MKVYKVFAVVAFALAAGVPQVAAQHYPAPQMDDYLKEDPGRFGINTHSYEFQPLSDTPAPRGYKPFYISYYARHGSRSDWAEYSYRRVVEDLSAARREGILRPEAELLLRDAERILALHDGMDGRLTPRGVREHRRLAERMFKRYPRVFRKGTGSVRAESSTVPRCLVSMSAACASLAALCPSLELSMDTGERAMAYIAQGSTVSIVERTRPVLDSIRHTWPSDSVTLYQRLFTDVQAGKALLPRRGRLEHDIFNTARIAEAFDIEDNLFAFISETALYKWYCNSLLELYLNEADSPLNGDERLPRSADLVDVIVRQADEAIGGGKYCADLRFGHDIPFVGLCCYFGLEGVVGRLSFEEVIDSWCGSRIVPFAANLQMVFYRRRGGQGDVLVKFLLNEQETLVPELTPVKGPYYRWADVKAMCASRPDNMPSRALAK